MDPMLATTKKRVAISYFHLLFKHCAQIWKLIWNQQVLWTRSLYSSHVCKRWYFFTSSSRLLSILFILFSLCESVCIFSAKLFSLKRLLCKEAPPKSDHQIYNWHPKRFVKHIKASITYDLCCPSLFFSLHAFVVYLCGFFLSVFDIQTKGGRHQRAGRAENSHPLR